jgi:hypothetical protein
MFPFAAKNRPDPLGAGGLGALAVQLFRLQTENRKPKIANP